MEGGAATRCLIRTGRGKAGVGGSKSAVIYSGLLSPRAGFLSRAKGTGQGEGEGEATEAAASETATAWTGGRRLFLRTYVRTWQAGCIDIASYRRNSRCNASVSVLRFYYTLPTTRYASRPPSPLSLPIYKIHRLTGCRSSVHIHIYIFLQIFFIIQVNRSRTNRVAL